MTTIGEISNDMEIELTEADVENARSEARLLISHVLGLTTAQVFNRVHEVLNAESVEALTLLARERGRGVPMAHLIGYREFWSHSFDVNVHTLVPRPESETLIELTLDLYAECQPPRLILDIGTGSGCLVLALLSEFVDAQAWATDVSAEALQIAASNAEKLGYRGRVQFRETTWTDGIEQCFDLIVSNPPYIATDEIEKLAPTVRDFEPRRALDGGEDGFDAYRAIFRAASTSLDADGVLLLEIGIDQLETITTLGEDQGFRLLMTRADLAGVPRALAFSKKSVGIQHVSR